MNTIVITGVAGFIGSSLAKSLCENGYDVIGIDNLICGYESNLSWVQSSHSFTFHKSNMCRSDLETYITKNQIVIHLACISSLATNQENPAFAYTNNVSVMADILEVCRLKGVKHLIFSSTSAIYENTNIFPTHENIHIKPNLVYSLVKKHCEDLIQSFHEVYGLNYTTLRLFNIYGPNQDALRKNPALVPYLIDCFKNEKQPILHSDGGQKRDYVYLDDLIGLFKQLILLDPLNTEINICSGTAISVSNIVETTQHIMKMQHIQPIYRDASLLWDKSTILWEGALIFSKDRMKQEVNKYSQGDPSKALQLVGWKATTTLEEGISRMCSI